MKKVLGAVAVVCVMCIAGSALAQTKERRNQQQQMNRPQVTRNFQDFNGRGPRPMNVSGDIRGLRGDSRPDMPGFEGRGFEGKRCGFEGRGRRGPVFTPDMPQEIRAKASEIAKLHIDLEEAMTSRPLNKQKALEVFAKIQTVRQEVDAWRFVQRLDRMEAWQKQQELNRTVPPATEKPAETPQPEAAK